MEYDIENLPGKRWALDRRAPCGINAFMRPCQTIASNNEAGHPNAEICKTDREIVYIVDDDSDLCAELAENLRFAGYTVATKPSVVELCKVVGDAKTGCILLDLKLPGMNGLEYQNWARKNSINIPVIFLTGHGSVEVAVHALKYGALDFLLKPYSELSVRQAINFAIAKSRQAYCKCQSAKMSQDLIKTLTPAEQSVAKMVADGFPTKLIATKLNRSENTVKIHKHRIFTKLQVSTAASVAHIVDLSNLLDNDA